MAEIDFGKYAILDSVEHRFEKEPEWFWRIKSVTSGDEITLQRFLAERKVIVSGDTREEHYHVNMEIVLREIALTFAGTNIPKTKLEDGEVKVVTKDGEIVPILNEKSSVDEIEAALKKFPKEMVMEIWDAVGEANPTWGPRKD